MKHQGLTRASEFVSVVEDCLEFVIYCLYQNDVNDEGARAMCLARSSLNSLGDGGT